jgi:hypothetical protein
MGPKGSKPSHTQKLKPKNEITSNCQTDPDIKSEIRDKEKRSKTVIQEKEKFTKQIKESIKLAKPQQKTITVIN